MSMQIVKMVVKLNIGEGNASLFKSRVSELKEIVAANEASTLNYEWFIDSNQQTCYILETYSDSDALLHHLNNTREKLGLILEIAPIEHILVFGDVTDQAASFLGSIGATIFPLHTGFSR